MKKIFTIMMVALLSVLSTVAQDANAEKFTPRYSVGASAFGGLVMNFAVGGSPDIWGVSGYGSFEAQLCEHSGVEFDFGSSIGSKFKNYLVTSLSYKFYSRSVNFNAGISYYANIGDNYSSLNGMALFVRLSKGITLYKSLYCEPFFDIAVASTNYESILASLGFALKYRF